MNLLEVRNVSRCYGSVRAVDDVSFDVAARERVALIGPNGAGKSTCFGIVGGQMRPDAGTVTLAGERVTGMDPASLFRRGLGRTFQVTATFASMTVAENVQTALTSHGRHSLRPFGRATRLSRTQAHDLLDRVGLGEQAERPCAELAYGDLKRVELAMALANAPRLLLMDEPTAGMAPPDRHALMELVSGLVQDRALAVLFTEHDMDIVFGHADRVLVLDHGRIVAAGDPGSVRANAEVRRLYLGESQP
ncbi:MAG: ATP-binding cassette domain-containing protein [Betaproteobacteria bacterium]|nr:ATP-binding cassette domain-containing protein [Betaproteobacteria bacterium]